MLSINVVPVIRIVRLLTAIAQLPVVSLAVAHVNIVLLTLSARISPEVRVVHKVTASFHFKLLAHQLFSALKVKFVWKHAFITLVMFALPVISVLAVFVRKTQLILTQLFIVTTRMALDAVQIQTVLQVFARNLHANL